MHRFRLAVFGAIAAMLLSGLLGVTSAPVSAATNGKIAFTSFRDDPAGSNCSSNCQIEIYAVNPDGTDLVNLTNSPGPDAAPKWSPDGSRIAFFSQRPGAPGLYVMNGDGSDQRRISTISPHASAPMDWSPDNTQIALSGGPFSNDDIHLVNVDGTGTTNLTNSSGNDWRPTWSPDGERIAFVSTRAHQFHYELFVMDRTGVNQTRLTFDDAATLFDPVWSPDGAQIAFSSSAAAGEMRENVYVIDPDGTNEQRLTTTGGPHLALQWSPDSSTIVYSAGLYTRTIFTIGRDGSGNVSPNPGGDSDGGPIWAPDGAKILFETRRDGNSEIYVMNRDGSDPVNLSDHVVDDYGGHDWQPLLNAAPDCSGARPSDDHLKLSRHRFERVAIRGVSDPDGDQVAIEITGVSQDEPVTGKGDRTTPDAKPANSPAAVRLRRERNPHGNGRVYSISFAVSDAKGGSCSGSVTVAAPRRAVDSAPPSYNSFG